MAELPADVKVKTEEALPAAPASYDGPGPLNEPPETVAQAAPPPPPADETQAADEQTPQVAQQTPVAMTPEQAAAAYAAQPDVQAAYAAAAAAYAAQPPQHYPQPQEVNRRLGQWTREEEAYAEKVAELFKTGRVPNCPEGTTMRALLADLLNCAPMRVSKKFSGERAIGKCSYKRSSADLDEEEAELKPLEQAFHDSVRGMGHLKMSLAHCSNLITPVAAKEQKRAQRVAQQQGQHSADLAWSHAAAQRQAHQTYMNTMRGQPPSNYFAGMSTTSAQAMYAQYYQQYPAHYYQDGAYAAAAQAAQGASEGEAAPAAAPAPAEGEEATAEQQAAAAQALLHPYMMLSPEQQQVMQAQYLAAYGYTAQAPAEAEAPAAEGAAPAAAAAASEPPAEAPPESLEPLAA